MAVLTRSAHKAEDTSRFFYSKLSQRRGYEAVNVEALKGILSYLKYFYAEGEISYEAYKVLVSQALSTFVENVISLKVERVFDDIDITLEKANEVFLTDILT
jgi:hypothetical protein